jgi:hypothetical protein
MKEGYEESLNVQTTNLNVETKGNINWKNYNLKINLKKLHAQKRIWKLHGKTSLCWRFYYVKW